VRDAPSAARHWRLRVLDERDIPALQRFFEVNPDYFIDVNGEPPRADEAECEFRDTPPAGMAYREMLMLGFFEGDGDTADASAEHAGELVAMATVVVGFIADHVWHIGLFIVATALHGCGAAHAIYRRLEDWIVARGAHWIRLGVVAGNTRAERFWVRSGYVQVRERGPVAMGQRMHLLRVMVKPIDGREIEPYLALVARDRPGAP
jgi:ribosomal protein S18 acetylase RimI-like enzyme